MRGKPATQSPPSRPSRHYLARPLSQNNKQLAPQIATFCALIRDPEHPPAVITNFKDFVRTYQSFVILRPLAENSVSQYLHFSCNCAVYAESLVCPCSLALSLFKGKCKAPLEKQLDLIGRLPQIGRPAKPASALKRQHPIGNVAAKLKRQASKRVREDQNVDCEARCSQPISNSLKCEVCDKATYGSKMLVCDICNLGYHIFCLVPRLETVPTNDLWICGKCMTLQEQYNQKETQVTIQSETRNTSIRSMYFYNVFVQRLWFSFLKPIFTKPKTTVKYICFPHSTLCLFGKTLHPRFRRSGRNTRTRLRKLPSSCCREQVFPQTPRSLPRRKACASLREQGLTNPPPFPCLSLLFASRSATYQVCNTCIDHKQLTTSKLEYTWSKCS